MPSTPICDPPLPDSIKTRIVGSRSAITDVAVHLWKHGFKKRFYGGGKGLSWQSFLRLVRQNWFRFEMWAAASLDWEDLDSQMKEAVEEFNRSG